MTKIKLSYETPEQLHKVLKLLSPAIKSYKLPKEQKGKYLKAYIDLKE